MKTIYQLKVSTNNITSLIFLESLLFSSSPLKKYFKILFIALPKKIKKFVLIKSPHINKKSKEHFQISTFQRLFYLSYHFSTKNLEKNSHLRGFLEQKILKHFFCRIPNDVHVVLKKTTHSS
jgi:hypothetical protein